MRCPQQIKKIQRQETEVRGKGLSTEQEATGEKNELQLMEGTSKQTLGGYSREPGQADEVKQKVT